ncbi:MULTISPECIES: N-acetyltransferase [Paenibacillus]|jgi:putative acetyltransferase|nr:MULTISPECIES: N-acetyltransferase [Paenibacillus]ALA41609.1 GNAT family acetyltransferase [Paenibacillus peoriae]APQ58820.1 GNAT family acetyltransferase [Paenibacillus polymyxa]MBP1175568.1 putative acetyltransferase [Paenibacillus sp. PvR133]MCP3744793.1 N-acetyltransferase [Paenibacillus sp. A3M_27_13]MXO78977.1 N-acetyltransferase [Paenibacillus sp. OT2-17]
MSIRPANVEELNELTAIWLDASIEAHHFIAPQYWASQVTEMENRYLPLAQNYVIIQDDHSIGGFVSMLDGYLAALFIRVDSQRKGYGKLLLDWIKKQHDEIQLKVYQSNTKAFNFYTKNGFTIQAESVDAETDEKEFVMAWTKH